MKNLILGVCLLFSISASAVDLSDVIVASPEKDAFDVTTMVAVRGAFLTTPVVCKTSGDVNYTYVSCSAERRVIYPEGNQDEGIRCMLEYSLNADKTYTRTTWECPVL